MSDDNPLLRAQELSRMELPKRFYKDVTVRATEGGHDVLLDNRPLKTPARNPLSVPTDMLARLIADEWDAQLEVVNPATMPVTRLANTAIDGVRTVKAEVARDVAAYACSDLVCYRAESPDSLIAAQREAWDGLINWFNERFGMQLVLAEGVMPISQDVEAADGIAQQLETLSAIELAALHTLTTLSGSAVLALAVREGRTSPDSAWEAAHVDEDWQMRQWGEDAEAMARRAARKREFDAAANVMAALQPGNAG
ncbi:ATP12 family chaperone protein [Tepidamorphus sp. 3E244]|uniref:ATP12 family chaperone protein n=1 Tax=Tepidamorphus sp. 3E244 TaxID=3385498 RepID=UPI0038FCE8FC